MSPQPVDADLERLDHIGLQAASLEAVEDIRRRLLARPARTMWQTAGLAVAVPVGTVKSRAFTALRTLRAAFHNARTAGAAWPARTDPTGEC